MSTLNEMVDEIKSNLQGYTLRQDRISYVANPAGLTTTSSAITIGSTSNLAKVLLKLMMNLFGLIPLIRQLTFLT
jgi:hypothetical protein